MKQFQQEECKHSDHLTRIWSRLRGTNPQSWTYNLDALSELKQCFIIDSNLGLYDEPIDINEFISRACNAIQRAMSME